MDYLPDEIILLIFKYASGYDLTTSFQMVCTRWNYLINKTESIWKGDIKLKGITEQQCKNKLLQVLKETPKLKYLQIGNPHGIFNINETGIGAPEEDLLEETENILETIRVYNKEIEYLHIIDRVPFCDTIRSIINRPRFKRLSITLDKLYDRREKINYLRRIFSDLPEVDNRDIDFCQRINFHCEKVKSCQWEIIEDCDECSSGEFS